MCPYCQTDQRHHLAPSESEDADRTTRFGLWILGVNVGVYLLMLVLDPARGDLEVNSFRPSVPALVIFGGEKLRLVRECGQVWRLLTSMFLHADLLHLIVNSIALLYLIPLAAGTFGVHRTVCLYFASGLCGATLSVANAAEGFAGGGGAVGVGASGALCGLIGACAVYGRRRGGAFGQELTRRMVGWVVLVALSGILWNRFGASGAINNAAHLGGFLGGAALGWLAAAVRARGGAVDRAWAFAARAIVVAALLVAGLFWAPFLLRGLEAREMDLYRNQARRTLEGCEDALGAARPPELPASFPDGPKGTEAVRDAVREALALTRSRDPGARAALARAVESLDQWSQSLACTHALD